MKNKKIFVVLDARQEEQPALVRVAYIAEATGASLHLFMCAYDTAIDAAPESQFHDSLNAAIMDRASYLAKQLDFELHVVSAYLPSSVFVLLTKSTESLVSYRSKMSAMVEANLKSVGEKYGVLDEHQHAIEGPVDWVIPKVSKGLLAEFVVMGNVSREGSVHLIFLGVIHV